MAKIRTTGLEQELLAERAAGAVALSEEEREKIADERHAERQAQLERLERESREERNRG